MKLNQFSTAVAFLGALVASQAFSAPSFVAERVLFNADPTAHATAIDLNNNGLVLAQTWDTTYFSRPFLWQAGTSDLVFGETQTANAMSLNDAGAITAKFPDNQGVIVQGSTIIPFGAPGMYMPNTISAQGNAFGEFIGGGTSEVFRAVARIDGVFQDMGIDFPGYSHSAAKGVNSSNHVVGTIQTPYVGSVQGTRAWFWQDGQEVLLPTHVPTDQTPASVAFSINDNDEIVGYDYSQGAGGAAVWKNQQITMLSSPGATYNQTQAGDINNHTQIVGIALLTNYSYAVSSIFWDTDGTAYDLNTITDGIDGWHLSSGRAINDSGQILVEGFFGTPDQIFQEGILYGTFLLTPIPEPGSVSAVVVAMFAALSSRRKRVTARVSGGSIVGRVYA